MRFTDPTRLDASLVLPPAAAPSAGRGYTLVIVKLFLFTFESLGFLTGSVFLASAFSIFKRFADILDTRGCRLHAGSRREDEVSSVASCTVALFYPKQAEKQLKMQPNDVVGM